MWVWSSYNYGIQIYNYTMLYVVLWYVVCGMWYVIYLYTYSYMVVLKFMHSEIVNYHVCGLDVLGRGTGEMVQMVSIWVEGYRGDGANGVLPGWRGAGEMVRMVFYLGGGVQERWCEWCST